MTAPEIRGPRLRAQVVAGTLYVLAMAALAAFAAWPIYASSRYILVVACAIVIGVAIAVSSRALRWPAWLTAIATAGAFLVIGVLVAVPPASVAELPASLVGVVTGVVTGFKDLVTVDLPVGSYRNLLVPVLVVMLVGTVTALLLAWRRSRIASLAVVVCLAMALFGLAFGRPFTSEPWQIGPIEIVAPRELATGALALIFSVGWLSWSALDERRRALRRAADTTGVRVSRVRSASERRRTLLAGGMVVASVVVAAAVAPAVAAERPRDVLRTGIGPEVVLRETVTPLSTFRDRFVDPAYDDILFHVESGDASRVRLATLTWYDGEIYRALDPSSSLADARFTRVPSTLDAGEGLPVSATITIGDLGGIWLPTVGRLERISFQGERASRLTDSFYYNAQNSAAVDTIADGLAPGDAYVVSGVEPETPDLATLEAPGVAGAGASAPQSLVEWMRVQDAGAGGPALAELVTRLRERGYLSHALQVDEADPPQWVSALEGYTFQPSAAGHSLARVDALFQQLLEREGSEPTGSLVAAIGDEEQFSVAVALIAEQLGFPARVVVGARLADDGSGLPFCVAGDCRGGDLTAWVEVQSSAGEWVPVEIAPQYTDPIDTDVQRERDPENVTEVRPETAQEVVPPDPSQQDSVAPDETEQDSWWDLAALWAGLRIAAIAGLALAILAGPFLLVVAAKATRRRGRRESPDAVSRVVGGWEEYVDAAVDFGLPAPTAQTRPELAEEYGGAPATTLAVAADRAVFADRVPSEEEAEEFWRIVDAQRRGFAEAGSWWRRLRTAVSLKSFTRSLASRTGRSHGIQPRHPERRMRRGGGAQST